MASICIHFFVSSLAQHGYHAKRHIYTGTILHASESSIILRLILTLGFSMMGLLLGRPSGARIASQDQERQRDWCSVSATRSSV